MSAFFGEPFTTSPLFESPTSVDDFVDYSSLLAGGGFSLMDDGNLFSGASSSMTSTQVVPDQQPSDPALTPTPSSSSKRKRSRSPSMNSISPAERGGGRRVWVRERSTEWWDHMSDAAACPEAEFRRAFRMPRKVFDKLCDDLAGAVAKEDTTLRAAIPVKQRVAVCLYRLATGDPLREVSRRFGLGISTCHNIILQVCSALTSVLLTRVVRWPDAASHVDFEKFPGVVGAVHTERIPIVAPRENAGDILRRDLLAGANDDGVDDEVVVAGDGCGGERVWSAAAEQVRDRIAHVLLHSGSASSSSYQGYNYQRL